jgi:hypothetical protein
MPFICEHCLGEASAGTSHGGNGHFCLLCADHMKALEEVCRQVDRACQVVLALSAYRSRAEENGTPSYGFGEVQQEANFLFKLRNDEHRLVDQLENMKRS